MVTRSIAISKMDDLQRMYKSHRLSTCENKNDSFIVVKDVMDWKIGIVCCNLYKINLHFSKVFAVLFKKTFIYFRFNLRAIQVTLE